MAASTDYTDTPISWDRHLKDFNGDASNCFPVSCNVSAEITCSDCPSFLFNVRPATTFYTLEAAQLMTPPLLDVASHLCINGAQCAETTYWPYFQGS